MTDDISVNKHIASQIETFVGKLAVKRILTNLKNGQRKAVTVHVKHVIVALVSSKNIPTNNAVTVGRPLVHHRHLLGHVVQRARHLSRSEHVRERAVLKRH